MFTADGERGGLARTGVSRTIPTLKRRGRWLPGLLLSILLLATGGCRGLGQTPPPSPFDPESLATALALTENAPPPGFETVAFPAVDEGLSELSGYHYRLEMRFEGVLDRDSQSSTTGHILAEVWWDGIAPARRVVLEAEGDSFVAEPRRLEGVRLGEDYYLVDGEGRCLMNVTETARAVANLDAGSLIGGVTEAAYSGTQAVLNGVQAYRYDVTVQNATLPAIYLVEDSGLDVTGELWVAPEYHAVVRYYANVAVSNVRLFESDLPVSGQVFIRYDMFDLDVVPNISIPYGC